MGSPEEIIERYRTSPPASRMGKPTAPDYQTLKKLEVEYARTTSAIPTPPTPERALKGMEIEYARAPAAYGTIAEQKAWETFGIPRVSMPTGLSVGEQKAWQAFYDGVNTLKTNYSKNLETYVEVVANRDLYTPESYERFLEEWDKYEKDVRELAADYEKALREGRKAIVAREELEAELGKEALRRWHVHEKSKYPDLFVEDGKEKWAVIFDEEYATSKGGTGIRRSQKIFDRKTEAIAFQESLQPTVEIGGSSGTFDALKSTDPITQFFAGLGAVPYSTFVSPFTGEVPPTYVGATGIIGLPLLRTRKFATPASEAQSKQLSELGSAYLAGSIVGEIAQAYFLGKAVSLVGSKVVGPAAKAVGRKILPYTWRVKLNLTPSPFVSLEQGAETSAVDAFKIVTKTKGGWQYVSLETSAAAPTTIHGTPTTPMAETLERALGVSSEGAQAVTSVLQEQAQSLSMSISQASSVRHVPVVVAGKTVNVPVQEIKDAKAVESAINTASSSIQSILLTVNPPNVESFEKSLSKIDKSTLETISPALDRDLITYMVPLLKFDTLTKVVPTLKDSQLVKIAPRLTPSQLEAAVPLIFPRLSPEELGETLKDFSYEQFVKVVPKLDERQLQQIAQYEPLRYRLLQVRESDDPRVAKLMRQEETQLKRRTTKKAVPHKLRYYKVTFNYDRGFESHKVEARSYHDALVVGLRLKKNVQESRRTELAKL